MGPVFVRYLARVTIKVGVSTHAFTVLTRPPVRVTLMSFLLVVLGQTEPFLSQDSERVGHPDPFREVRVLSGWGWSRTYGFLRLGGTGNPMLPFILVCAYDVGGTRQWTRGSRREGSD